MSARVHKRFTTSIIAAALLAACTSGAARWFGRHAYPPSFEFLAKKEVGSAMRKLAEASHELDRLLRQGDLADAHRRTEITRLLDEMESTEGSLGAGKWPANHPMLSSRIGLFYDDVRAARHAVAAEPPSYVMAGTVSGACVYCHSAR